MNKKLPSSDFVQNIFRLTKFVFGLVFLLLISLVFISGQDQMIKRANALPFNNPTVYNVGFAKGIVAEDFNNDGKKDLVVINSLANTANIFLGNGSGGFTASGTKSLGAVSNPYSIISLDLNNDNKKDLITANGKGGGFSTVSILLGNGNGTFANAVVYNVLNGNQGFKIVAADFNNDNKIDLALTNWFSNNVSILKGNGNGTFTIPAITFSVGNRPSGIDSQDLNGDNNKDLVVVNADDNNFYVYFGNGNYTFSAPVIYSVGNKPFAVELNDYNQDSFIDIAVTNRDDHNGLILLNDGLGNFTEETQLMTSANPENMISADFNGDNILDLISQNAGGSGISLLMGLGNGHFVNVGNYYTGNVFPKDLTCADFNNDGRLDIAATGPNEFGVILNLDNPFIASISPSVVFVGSPNTEIVITGSGFATNSEVRLNDEAMATTYVSGAKLKAIIPSIYLEDVLPVNISVHNPSSGKDSNYYFLNIEPGFMTAEDYAVSSGPSSMVYADFNNDGKEDFAVTNSLSNNVTIYLNVGDGTADISSTVAVGSSPESLAKGDFNADNNMDLAVANSSSNSISILINNGDGTFNSGTSINTSSQPKSVIAADYNNDNKQDLAIANYGSNNVEIYLGNGDGTFIAPTTIAVGSQPRFLEVNDFDSDLNKDLAVVNSGSNNIGIFLGNGDGTFISAGNVNTGSQPQSIAIGDYNNDGKADLASANSASNNITIALGNGNGTFANFSNFTTANQPKFLISGDFNEDQKYDLAVVSYVDSSLLLYLGKGDGNFGVPYTYSVIAQPKYLISIDLNNDGKNDLISANYISNKLSVLLRQELAVTLFAPADNHTVGDRPKFLASGDFNKDGYADIAVTLESSNELSVLLNNRVGGFNPGVNYSTGGVLTYGIAAADLNNDTCEDLAMVHWNSASFSVFLNNCDGTFAAPIVHSETTGLASIFAAKIDADANLDLLINNKYYRGNGDGTFIQPGITIAGVTGGGGFYSSIVIDLDQDDLLDIASVDQSTNSVSVILGNGDGTFSSPTTYAVGGKPSKIIAADLNSDEILDLATVNSATNNVSVLLGNGDGTYKSPYTSYVYGMANSMASGDFNGDGKIDLATLDASLGVSVLLGNNNGTFQFPILYSAQSNPSSIISGDFNKDTKSDLAVANWGSASISILQGLVSYNRGVQGGTGPLGPINLTCHADSPNSIIWSFTDQAINETGFKLYGPSGLITDSGNEISINLTQLSETNLLPNTFYQNRYVVAFNGEGDSQPSNTAACYTYANAPISPFIEQVVEGQKVILNPNDGNPSETQYAIFEYSSKRYVQTDGTLNSEPVWQTYVQWGGSEGIIVLSNSLLSIYQIQARNGAGFISSSDVASRYLTCRALDSSQIEWTLSSYLTSPINGFRLYEPQEPAPRLVADIAEAQLNQVTYIESGLQPNSQQIRFFKTYVNSVNGQLLSEQSNQASCYTLANEPLPVKLGEVINNEVQVILDNNDGNPPDTLYSIYEAKSGKYVQADGSLGDEPYWQTYEQWGSTLGIYVDLSGAEASFSGQFKISMAVKPTVNMAVDLSDFEFVPKVKNESGFVTEEKIISISVSKTVAKNLAKSQTIFNLSQIARAEGEWQKVALGARLLQEFSLILNLVLIILAIIFIVSLLSFFKNFGGEIKLKNKIKLFIHSLSKEPAVLFAEHAPTDHEGTYAVSFSQHKRFQDLSRKALLRTVGLLGLKLVIIIVLALGLVKLNKQLQAQEVTYNLGGETVKANDRLSYKIDFANTGNEIAKNVTVTDVLDPKLVYLADSAIVNGPAGTVSFNLNTLNIGLGDLAPQQSGSITFDTTVSDSAVSGSISNSAEIKGDNFTAQITKAVINPLETLPIITKEKVTPDTENKIAPETQTAPTTTARTNQAPVAVGDSAETEQNLGVVINVLANDSDPDNNLEPSTLAIIANPQNGQASMAEGAISYIPNKDFSGADSLSYKICDSLNSCAEATVSIAVKPIVQVIANEIKEPAEVTIAGSLLQTLTSDVTKSDAAQNFITEVNENKTVQDFTNSAPVKFINKQVLDNPTVEAASQEVVTPVLVTVAVVNTIPAVAAVSVNIWSYLHFIFVEPFVLIFRRKRKKWGVVYDSLTKMPLGLAVVRLYSGLDKKLIQTKVTDKEGRYLMLIANPGQYYIEVSKPEYEYPSKFLSSVTEDTKYIDLYHGEPIEIKESGQAISFNIPLDTFGKKISSAKEVIRSYVLKNMRLVTSYLGLILAAVVLFIYPSFITVVALILHIIFYLAFRRMIIPPRPKNWGILVDQKTKEPLHYGIIRIFDTKFNKLLETQVTDHKGRYAFLVSKNVYNLMAEKEGYQKKQIPGVDLIKNDEIVNLDIELEKNIIQNYETTSP